MGPLGTLGMAVQVWPTPQARDGKGTDREQLRAHNARPLNELVAHWPAPTSLSFDGSHHPGNSRSYNRTMELAAGLWRSPTSSEEKRGATPDWTPKPQAGEHSLTRQASLWSPPSVADVEGGRTSRSGDRKDELLLNTQAKAASSPSSLPALVIWRLGPPCWRDRLTVLRLYRTLTQPRAPTWARLRTWAARATRPKLSAAFVEWLMGWPPGWTACACSATELSRFRARMRSALWALPSHDAPPAQPSLFG